jgi:ketosteroid isomerase-like protein
MIMPDRDIAALVRRCYDAYQTKRRDLLETLLADDFVFSSPLDDRIDRKTYFERCWPNSVSTKRFTILQLFVQGDEAFARYELETTAGKLFRNTEFFRFRGDRLVEVDVYFGRTLREAA